MENFTEKFHKLSGGSVAEHKKLFNVFVHNLEGQGQEFSTEFAKNVTPQNNQQEIFRVKLLIKYECTSELLQILLGGNRILSRLVVKSCVRKIFPNISSTEFIRNICPKISFVNRMGIIYKLSFCIDNENVGEEYFNAVYNEYGLKIAAPLLAICGVNFIRAKITTIKLKISERHLINLHKKYPDLIPDYFKELSKYEDNCFQNCGLFARYLALNDVLTFWDLLKYGFPKIGKRGCCNILRTYKSEMIKNPEKYKKFANTKFVLRTLSYAEFDQIFRNLFPKSVDNLQIHEGIHNCIQILPKIKRFSAFKSAFKDVYGFEFEKKMCEHQLNQIWFTPEDQRFFIDDIESYNIELIKEKIKVANDIKIRTELLCKLIKTCKIISDNNVLLDVLNYFKIRHRNEPVEVRRTFLTELLQNFVLYKLNETLWDVIIELLNFFIIDGDLYYDRCYYMAQYIHFKLIRGLDVREEVKDWVKGIGLYGPWSVIGYQYPQYEKICLLHISEFLEEFYPNDKQEVMRQYVHELQNWNKKFPKNSISYYKFPEIIKQYFNKAENYHYYYWIGRSILLYIPQDENEKIIRKEVINQLIKDFPNCMLPIMMNKFLKNEPNVVINHIDLFFEKAEEDFYYELSKMQYHDVYKLIKERAEIGIKSDDIEKVKSSLKFYSFERGFYNFASQYIPLSDKIDPSEKLITDTRKYLLKCLKNPSKPEDFIPISLAFSNRDYLRYTLEALYFILFHSREELVYNPVSSLINKAVSIRKHALFLGTSLCSQEKGMKILQNMVQNEKNSSVRKFILKRTFKYLSAEGTELLWGLLKPQLKTIDLSDWEIMGLVFKFNMIPRKYISEYATLIWENIKNCKERKENEILNLIKPDMFVLLPIEILTEIVQKTMFEENWNEFVVNLLFSQVSAGKDIVFHCIQEAIKEDPVTSGENIKKFYNLYENICKRVIKEKADITLLKSYSFVNHCNTDLYFILLDRATETLVKNHNLSLSTILIQLQNEILNQFGEKMLIFYSDFALRFLSLVFSTNETEDPFSMIEVVEEIVKGDSSEYACILSLELLPFTATLDLEFKRRRTLILRKMFEHPSNIVKIYLSRFLLKLN